MGCCRLQPYGAAIYYGAKSACGDGLWDGLSALYGWLGPETWGFTPCWYVAGPLALKELQVHDKVYFVSANGAFHTNLGQSLRNNRIKRRSGLKARAIFPLVPMRPVETSFF